MLDVSVDDGLAVGADHGAVWNGYRGDGALLQRRVALIPWQRQLGVSHLLTQSVQEMLLLLLTLSLKRRVNRFVTENAESAVLLNIVQVVSAL